VSGGGGAKSVEPKILKMKLSLSFSVAIFFLVSCTRISPPEPFGPVPSERQIAWHQMEYYMFVHFTVNTFTDKEWSYGHKKKSIFNPTELDCRQ